MKFSGCTINDKVDIISKCYSLFLSSKFEIRIEVVSKLILNLLLSVVFFLIATALVLILTPPCSLSKLNVFTKRCLSSDNNRVQDYHRQVQYLEDRIASLQKEILDNECSLNSFVVSSKGEDDDTRLTEEQVNSFKNLDLSALAGCWEFVGTSQEFAPIGCEVLGNCAENISRSSNAEYCFDENGDGEAKTDFAGGSCRAPTKSEFYQDGNESPILNFTEISEAPCDSGVGFSNLVARNYECKLTDGNRIACTTSNSFGRSGNIVLKRRSNGQ